MIIQFFAIIIFSKISLINSSPWMYPPHFIPCPYLWNFAETSLYPQFSSSNGVSEGLFGSIPKKKSHFHGSRAHRSKKSTKTRGELIPYIHFAESTTSKPKDGEVKSVSFNNFMGKLTPSERSKRISLNLTDENEWRTLPEEILLQDNPTFGGDDLDDNNGYEVINDDIVESIRKSNKMIPSEMGFNPGMDFVDNDYVSEDWINQIAGGKDFNQVLPKELEEVNEEAMKTDNEDNNDQDQDEPETFKLVPVSKKPEIVSHFRKFKADSKSEEKLDPQNLNEALLLDIKEAESEFGRRKKPIVRDMRVVRLPVSKNRSKQGSKPKTLRLVGTGYRNPSTMFRLAEEDHYGVRRIIPQIQTGMITVKTNKKKRKKATDDKNGLEILKTLKLTRKKKPKPLIRLVPVPQSNSDTFRETIKPNKARKSNRGYIIVPESSKRYRTTDYFPYQYNVEMRSRRQKKGFDDGANAFKLHEQKEEEHWHEKKWKKGELLDAAEYGNKDESEKESSNKIFHLDPDIFDSYHDYLLPDDSSHYNIPSKGFRVDKRFVNWAEKAIDMEKDEQKIVKHLMRVF